VKLPSQFPKRIVTELVQLLYNSQSLCAIGREIRNLDRH